jgi:hypothetical protein
MLGRMLGFLHGESAMWLDTRLYFQRPVYSTVNISYLAASIVFNIWAVLESDGFLAIDESPFRTVGVFATILLFASVFFPAAKSTARCASSSVSALKAVLANFVLVAVSEVDPSEFSELDTVVASEAKLSPAFWTWAAVGAFVAAAVALFWSGIKPAFSSDRPAMPLRLMGAQREVVM